MTESLFELHDVSFAVPGRRLLEPLSLTLPARRMIGLIGHNGSGKSTLVKILARQQAASGGEVRFQGRALSAWGDREFARKLAYLPQHTPSTSGLLVKELVALGRYPWRGALGRFDKSDRDKIDEAIALTDLEPLADRLVDTLSGGERQRAWLAMLLAQDAECLLLDEPTSALDASVQAEVLNLLEEVRRRRQLTYLMVSHDLAIITHMCGRLMVMQNGETVENLEAGDLAGHRVSQDYTRNLLKASEGFSRKA